MSDMFELEAVRKIYLFLLDNGPMTTYEIWQAMGIYDLPYVKEWLVRLWSRGELVYYATQRTYDVLLVKED